MNELCRSELFKILFILIILGFSLSASSQLNMREYLTDTREIVKEKKYKEALERFIWFHDHALEYDKAMAGVRLSFALSDWKQLGEVYPPALTALIEIRDRKTEQVLNEGSSALFGDVVAINRVMGENSKTIDLFQKLMKIQSANAKKFWIYARETLFKANRYDLIDKFIDNPLDEYSTVKGIFDRNVKLYSNDKIGGEHFKSYNERRFTEQCIQLMDLSYFKKDTKSAKEIHDKVLTPE